MLSVDAKTWTSARGVVLWHARTGRHAVLAQETLDALERGDDPRLEPVRRRLRALYLLADGPQAPVLEMIPARSRLVLCLPDVPALWVPVPDQRTSGGFGYRVRRLSPVELALWAAINDSRPMSALVRLTGASPWETLAFLASLTAPEVQAIQLRDQPPRPRDASLERLVAVDRPAAPRGPDLLGPGGETELGAYHHQIPDGTTHFDDRETTLAHALAIPHPALGGNPYGAALHDALAGRGLVPEAGQVVEVGCGTGEMAAAWCGRCSLPYLRVDRSPELLRTQGERAPDTAGVLGDATALPIAEASVDILLCNEVIADLSAVPAGGGEDGPAAREVVERRSRYGLYDRAGLHNLGAWKLVEEVARVLRPGGSAFLSEFGDLDAPPEEATHLDHPEVSIHFGELVAVARSLGLQVECLPLPELLGMDLGARWLARSSYEAVRALARARGVHLEARAWTADTIREVLPWPVEGLREVPLAEPGPGPLPTRFQAVLLTRPA